VACLVVPLLIHGVAMKKIDQHLVKTISVIFGAVFNVCWAQTIGNAKAAFDSRNVTVRTALKKFFYSNSAFVGSKGPSSVLEPFFHGVVAGVSLLTASRIIRTVLLAGVSINGSWNDWSAS
jgi:hypothetical protein